MKLAEVLRLSRLPPPVPKGWLTIDQLARSEGRPHARGGFTALVRECVAAGILKRKVFKVSYPSGTRKVMHYRRA